MKIAVFLPNWIGDAVMATPALRALREKFYDADCIGVFKPYIRGVLEGSSWFDSVILLDKGGGLVPTMVVSRLEVAAIRN